VADVMNDVIVADDDPLLVNALSEIFKGSGYTVRTASDGFGALTLMRERVPDILISDLNMPRMSGFELLSIVQRRFPSIAVIAMSGAYSDVAVPEGIAADAFYAKGSSSWDRFVEILYAIKDEATRRSLRAAVPIWIPGVPIDQNGLATIAVACPECLGTSLIASTMRSSCTPNVVAPTATTRCKWRSSGHRLAWIQLASRY